VCFFWGCFVAVKNNHPSTFSNLPKFIHPKPRKPSVFQRFSGDLILKKPWKAFARWNPPRGREGGETTNTRVLKRKNFSPQNSAFRKPAKKGVK